MDYKKIQEKVNSLIGQKLTNVCTAAEMLRFYFDNDHGIHSLCLTRVRKKEDILLTSFDYYNWDEKDDKNNDEWYYLEKYKEDIVGGIVAAVTVTPLRDLILHLDNEIIIEFFIANGYFHFGEDDEQWRYMNENEHLAVNSKSVSITSNKDYR